jgi:two-component system nitrogen regulation sensor histidine kinase NtrY
MTPRTRKNRVWLAVGGAFVVLLVAAVFTLGSLDVPFRPKHWRDVLLLFPLTTFIVATLLIFALILMRSLLRTWAEGGARQLGSRFKQKMVLGAMSISLLPVVFMFIISYGLINRTLARWFPAPLEIAAKESQDLVNDLGRSGRARMEAVAAETVAAKNRSTRDASSGDAVLAAIRNGADAAWILRGTKPLHGLAEVRTAGDSPIQQHGAEVEEIAPQLIRTLPSGAEIWQANGNLYVTGRASLEDGTLVAARRVPETFLPRLTAIETQLAAYNQEKQDYRLFKRVMQVVLLMFTVLLLSAVTWVALFLSKQVTVPIQALAEGTREVMAGNLAYQVPEQAQDELGTLVRSFNQMTAQLHDSRRQIDEFTHSLQVAVQELERRRKLMEAILENTPTGVISLDESGAIVRVNAAAVKIFGEPARTAKTLEQLAGEDAAPGLYNLMRRSSRMGVVSEEVEISLAGRVLHAAVTVSSLGPRRANLGYVFVVDDLTELLRAQKAAAWQEVARRIAHEIKNPLTPIQLSAERLTRYLDRRAAQGDTASPAAVEEGELSRLVRECAGLIEREVSSLASLVNEFSQFVRFPTARLSSTDANTLVANALEVFSGRLDGIAVRTSLAEGLPFIRADAELLCRVLVNLIDNAAEAMEGSAAKELRLSTRLLPDGEAIEIAIADTGNGISPEDKDKLFLPHFSTKDRGTGLGLAIAARIIAEHSGAIRVEDNVPIGTRFVIQLPVSEGQAVPLAAEN